MARMPFREHDEIISIITKDVGRIDVRTKGSKKITSKLSSHLEPFTHLLFDSVQGKEMTMLISATVRNFFPLIRSEFTKSMQAEYAAHAIYKLTRPGNLENGICELFLEWLKVVEKTSRLDDCRFLDWLMLELVSVIGFKPQYSECVRCGRADGLISWSFGEGGVVCNDCASHNFEGNTLTSIKELTLHDFSRLDKTTLGELEVAQVFVPEVHSLIVGSLQYHSEVKIGDWEFACMV